MDKMRSFIDESYDENGASVPSPFMREVALSGYEPACIEAIHSKRPEALGMLLTEVSYAAQWLQKVETNREADAAICVFAPNRVGSPHGCSLEYVGAFDYEPSRA